jgi:hypothetical protein
MTGKVLDSSPSGVLILIIPAAVAVIFLYNFWPIILAIAIFSIAWTVWQNYQWQQTCIKVNPYFNQLLKENQGCLTPVDLSLKANLSGSAARSFLEKKAVEYGGKRQNLPDKGVVYYFITASSLGSIFDDSDFLVKASEEKAIAAPEAKPKPQISAGRAPSIERSQFSSKNEIRVQEPELATVPSSNKVSSEPTVDSFERQKETEAIESTPAEAKHLEEIKSAPQEEKTETVKEEQIDREVTTPAPSKQYEPLIQSELAKRLEINPSTIGRKKSDSDFPQWSQSRDPEGVSWQYVAETRMFVPVDGT